MALLEKLHQELELPQSNTRFYHGINAFIVILVLRRVATFESHSYTSS
jgi:hypothetical protein